MANQNKTSELRAAIERQLQRLEIQQHQTINTDPYPPPKAVTAAMGKKRDRSTSNADSTGDNSSTKKEKQEQEQQKKKTDSAKKAKKIEVVSTSTTTAVTTVATHTGTTPIKNEQHTEQNLRRSNQKNGRPRQEPVKAKAKSKAMTADGCADADTDKDHKPFFFKRRVRLSLSLLPSSLHNSMASIENCFRRMLLKYDDGLKGMLLAYDDIKVEDNNTNSGKNGGSDTAGHGWILNELPYIHYSVSCTALVFAPSVGCELQGVVSQCFASHLSILVYGYVNAMIPSSEIREEGYAFDPDSETWSKQGGSQSIAAGNKVNFLVQKVHECDGTLSMEGVKPVRSLLVESTE